MAGLVVVAFAFALHERLSHDRSPGNPVFGCLLQTEGCGFQKRVGQGLMWIVFGGARSSRTCPSVTHVAPEDLPRVGLAYTCLRQLYYCMA